MTRRRNKGLSPEDRRLWDAYGKLMDHRRPTDPTPEPPHPKHPPRPVAPEVPAAQDPSPRPFQIGGRAKTAPPAHQLHIPAPDRLHDAPRRMDAKAHKRLRTGKIRPEARIDLHGMTLAEAHPALAGFVLWAQGQGKRVVLVITGKGREDRSGDPIPTPTGRLRHQLPLWAHQPPLLGIVQQVVPAHQRHGGAGAFYLYLRRL